MTKRTKVGLVVAGLVGFLGLCVWTTFRTTYGVGVDSVSWLPREARNVTYFRNGLNSFAEFDVEREAFAKWCAKRKMPLQELTDGGSHAVTRCLQMLENRGVIQMPSVPDGMSKDEFEMTRTIKSFSAGDLFYEERWSNGGGYTLGYDVQAKRGYYQFAHH